MRIVEVRNRDRRTTLGRRVEVADRWWPRLRGYLGRPEPRPGEGILFVSTQSIHMYWMKYPLDVAFLDEDRRVVAAYPELGPGTRTRFHRKARYALEVPAGTLAETGTVVGDELRWENGGVGSPEADAVGHDEGSGRGREDR